MLKVSAILLLVSAPLFAASAVQGFDPTQFVTRLAENSTLVGLLGWLVIKERQRSDKLLDKVLEVVDKKGGEADAMRLVLLQQVGRKE